MRKLGIIGFILLIAGVFASVEMPISAKSRKGERKEMGSSNKADYFFMEGLRQEQLGNSDAYFELLKRAHALNPDDKFISKTYGFNLMRIAEDSLMTNEGYDLMEGYIKENPDDFYSSVLFAALSTRLGKHDKATETWSRLYSTHPEREVIALRYADALFESGEEENMHKALEIYDKLEQTEGISMEITSQKLRVNVALEDTAAVIADINKLIASSPTMAEYSSFAGDIYSYLGMGDSAIYHYDRAVELDPTNGYVYYSRARYFQSIGDSTNFNKEVYRALDQEDLDLDAKLEILRGYAVEFYTDSLEQPKIKSMFDRLIELHPHESEIHTFYQDYLIAINDYSDAAEQASYALDIDPSDPQQWIVLTTLYIQTGEMGKAHEAATRGVHFFPENSTLYFLDATALSQSDDYDDALKALEKATEFAESDAGLQSDIYTLQGDIFYRTNQQDSAFSYYSKALELNPENMLALNNCAYYLACEDRNLDEALEMIEKVIEERPTDATSLDTYAWVLFKMKDYDGAKDAIDLALENSEEPSGELFEHAGDIYFMLREPNKAMEFWKKALELDPENELLTKKVKYRTYFYE